MKKRDELECVGGVKGRKITMNLGMYVRGCGCVVSINMISIDNNNNNRLLCVCFVCLLFSTTHTVLCCCAAGKLSIRKHTTPYRYVLFFRRCLPISFAVAVAVVSLGRWNHPKNEKTFVLVWRQIRSPSLNLGDCTRVDNCGATRSFFSEKRGAEVEFPCFDT